MSCDITHEQLIDYLYDEDIRPDERERLKVHIETCPSCKQSLEELGTTSRMLNAWPDEAPNLDLVFVQERQSFWQNLRPTQFPRRWAIGTAIAAAAVLVLTFLNIEFAIRDGAFHASIGLRSNQPTEQLTVTDTSGASQSETPVTWNEFVTQQQNMIDYTNHLVQTSEDRQRDDVNSTFIRLVRELETQRQKDLQRVDRGLQVLYNTQETRYDHLLRQMPLERLPTNMRHDQPTQLIPTSGTKP